MLEDEEAPGDSGFYSLSGAKRRSALAPDDRLKGNASLKTKASG